MHLYWLLFLCSVYNLQIYGQACDGMKEYQICSRYSGCLCFYKAHLPNTTICGDGFSLSCNELVRCEHSDYKCRNPEHECIYHRKCQKDPVCYPVASYNKQYCPPAGTVTTATLTMIQSTTSATTTATATTSTSATTATTPTAPTTATNTITIVPLNLLINPGAESSSMAGWTKTGASEVLQDTGGALNSGYNPHSGNACFAGGLGSGGPSSSLSQTVDLLNGIQNFSTVDLNAGTLHASVSFYYQSYYHFFLPYDNAEVKLTFLSATSTVLSTASSGSQTCSAGGPGWCSYSGLFSLPVGARSITYQMVFTRNSGTKINAYIDDNFLSIV